MPKADQMFGFARLSRRYPETKWFVALVVGLVLVFWGVANYGDAATITDLEGDLEEVVGIEYYSIDEIMFLVGPAWGYNVSQDGIVTLDDGEFDLRDVIK